MNVTLYCSGNVYSCGLNDSHQLGQNPAPPKSLLPRPVSIKRNTFGATDACHRMHIAKASLIYKI